MIIFNFCPLHLTGYYHLIHNCCVKYNRKSIRLNSYDYSKNGYYFVTVCTQNRWNIFGEIKNKKMIPNDIGKMIIKIWNEIPNNYDGIEIDEFVLMPDHLHGILVINKNLLMDNLPNGRTRGPPLQMQHWE